jgi:hypothetical protein
MPGSATPPPNCKNKKGYSATFCSSPVPTFAS